MLPLTRLPPGSFGRHILGAVIVGSWVGCAVVPAQANGGCHGTLNGSGGVDYLVSGAETRTCHITTNDTLTVMNGGSIIVGNSDGNAVEASGTPISVVNDGLISASEAFKAAIDNAGALGSFVNTGTIEGLGTATALFNTGTITLLNNNGGIITSAAIAIDQNSGSVTITNDGGEISSTGGVAINSFFGTVNLDNTNGVVETTGSGASAIRIFNSSVNNTNGMIRASDGSGLNLQAALTGPLINTGGTLSSGASNPRNGGVRFDSDMGNLTVLGGTIINTNSGSDNGSAVSIDTTQTGTITFDGVTITADGTGLAQANAFYFFEYNSSILLTSTTSVRGNFTQAGDGAINIATSGTILGNIIMADEPDTVTVNGGSVTGNTEMMGDDDIFELNGGVVTGNLDMGDDNDTATINGGLLNGLVTMGSGDNTFVLNGGTLNGSIDFSSGNDIFTYAGGVLNGNINFGNGVNTLSVNSMWTPTGTLTTGGSGATNLNIGHTGNLILDNAPNLQAGQIKVMMDGRLHLRGGNLSGATFENRGVTRIGVGRTLMIGAFDNTVQGLLIFDTSGVNNLMKTGKIEAFESASDLSKQMVQVNYLGGQLTLANRSLIMAGDDTGVFPLAPVTDNSLFYNFGIQADPSNPDDLYLILTQAKTIEDVASSPKNAKTANVLLNELGGSNDPVVQGIQQRLNNASSDEEFNEIIESTQQTVDQGNQVAAVGMTGAMFDLADGQLAMVNTGGGTGVGGGNELKGLHFWAQGFGGWADQGFRNGADGYRANVRGVALGADTRNFREDTVAGLSLGSAGTDVKSDNANMTRTDVESYQLMAYGNHELGNDIFLTGMALYGWNPNDQTRFNVGGTAGQTALAEYDSWVGGLRSSIGRNIHFPADGSRAAAFLLTPQLFSEYVHFSRDGYTETGAGGAAITAGDAGQTIWNVGLSLQAEWTFVTENGGRLKPDIHASYKYDLIDDAADTTSTFVAGGSTIGVDGVDPANSVFGVGVGLKFHDASGWDFTAAYDYTFKDEYEAHPAYARAAYEF